MPNPIYITEKDFEGSTLKFPGLSVVECMSNNNGLLKTMEPVLVKLKEGISIPFNHLRINLQIGAFIIHQFHVLKEPSYLIFFNGEFIDRVDGIISYNDFSKRINGHITSLT